VNDDEEVWHLEIRDLDGGVGRSIADSFGNWDDSLLAIDRYLLDGVLPKTLFLVSSRDRIALVDLDPPPKLPTKK
jgi:hypothetical protein